MTLQGTSNNSGISMEHMQNMHVWKYCFVILLFIGAYSKYNANQITMNIYLIPAITNNSI